MCYIVVKRLRLQRAARAALVGEWEGLSERHETVSIKRLWSGRGLALLRGDTTGEQIDKTFCFYVSILVFRHDCLFLDVEAH